MKKPKIPVAKEGYPFIFFGVFSTIVAAILGYEIAALTAFFITAFVLYFFRDPERTAPEDDDALVSPADGKIILIEKIFDDKFVKEHVYKVSIFMNVFNVHVNRVPFPGRVSNIIYSPGSFYSANSERGALKNEFCAVTITTESDKKMAFVQVAGLIARRIVCWAEKGDEFAKGERFGLIRFGSRVDLYLPLQVQLEVIQGQKVRAGETILGYLS
ncbi:MAG: phosphatidylserine decarboxylase family protein [Proteobacteria bacterium]|nr:phosphatidylserine decarboxylase family protein [Pseudomonadota bacterium]MBU1715195.1 phosphatidylserine decarboxylase family protein [Pseudomonadota bacterium]